MPVTYTVSFRTVDGYPASVQILAKSSAHAQNSAKELFPEIHRVTGALLTPLWN